jgi:hypothetical protein
VNNDTNSTANEPSQTDIESTKQKAREALERMSRLTEDQKSEFKDPDKFTGPIGAQEDSDAKRQNNNSSD